MTNPDERFTIGALSKRTGCKIVTIRYYEKIGLLPVPLRSEGGHRHYDDSALKRLTFVLQARKLGFSLEAVRTLLVLADGDGGGCADVEYIAARHLNEVRRKINHLSAMEAVLAEMVKSCREDQLPHCPLIGSLFDDQSLGRLPRYRM